jgi:DNA end-binding protein Ku
LPALGKGATQARAGELKMAVQLVKDMTGIWKPADYHDKFTSAIHALAAQRLKAGKTKKVTSLEDAGVARQATNVVDLTELLKKSLATRKSGSGRSEAASEAAPARKAAGKAAATRAAKSAGTAKAKTKRAA